MRHRILSECNDLNLKPEFYYDSSTFKFELQNEKMSGKNVGDMSGKTPAKIIALIGNDNQISIPQMAKIIGVTERTIERNLKKLQDEDRLKRIGGAKGGHWKIT